MANSDALSRGDLVRNTSSFGIVIETDIAVNICGLPIEPPFVRVMWQNTMECEVTNCDEVELIQKGLDFGANI